MILLSSSDINTLSKTSLLRPHNLVQHLSHPNPLRVLYSPRAVPRVPELNACERRLGQQHLSAAGLSPCARIIKWEGPAQHQEQTAHEHKLGEALAQERIEYYLEVILWIVSREGVGREKSKAAECGWRFAAEVFTAAAPAGDEGRENSVVR